MSTVHVLVIGSGAREHALLLALRRDPEVTGLSVAPVNAGTAIVADQYDVDITSGEAVVGLVRNSKLKTVSEVTEPVVYVPVAQYPYPRMTVVVFTSLVSPAKSRAARRCRRAPPGPRSSRPGIRWGPCWSSRPTSCR